MDSDRALGALIIAGVIVVAILFFGSFFLPWSFTLAVEIVVSIGLLIVLGIGGWIGWTMASTPSPEAIEDLDIEDLEEEEEVEK